MTVENDHFHFFLFSRFNKIWKNTKWLEQGIERRKKKRDFSDINPPIGVSALWILLIVNPQQLSLSLSPPRSSFDQRYIVISGYSPPEPFPESHTRDLLKTGNKNGRRPHDHPQLIYFYFCGWLDFFPYFIAHLRFSFRHTLSNLCVQCRFLALFFFLCVCMCYVGREINKTKTKKLRWTNGINPDWGQNKERDAEEGKAWRRLGGEVDSNDGYPKSREKVVIGPHPSTW